MSVVALPVRALVLSGGGARGAYEAGAAKALLESESYDVIVGSSVGAINAAFAAQDRIRELERLWRRIATNSAFRFVAQTARLRHIATHLTSFGHDGLLSDMRHAAHALHDYAALGLAKDRAPAHAARLAQVLEELVGTKVLRRSLIVTAADLSRGVTTAFYSFVGHDAERLSAAAPASQLWRWVRLERQNLAQALAASAALPGLFAPLEADVDGTGTHTYADGGVAHNTPIRLALAAGATDLTVIMMDPPDEPCSCELGQVGQMACTIFSLLKQRILEGDLRLIEAENEIIRRGGGDGKQLITVREIRPARPLPLGIIDFDDQNAINSAFVRGEIDGALSAEAALT